MINGEIIAAGYVCVCICLLVVAVVSIVYIVYVICIETAPSVAAPVPRPAVREAVYNVVDSEREYQNELWDDANNTVGDWLTYIRHYTRLADEALTVNGGDEDALHVVRKLTALGVACMEQHGAPRRDRTQ